LVDLGLTDDWQHTIDSTSVRDYVSAAGGKGACANALGRSRGGFTSRIHARFDNQGLPVGFILTGGEASDYTAAEPLMAIPVTTPKALLADKGYDGDRFRESLLLRCILLIIPPRSNRKVPEHPDCRRYRDRTARSATNCRYRSCWHQGHMARPDARTLEGRQPSGPASGCRSYGHMT
jgi:transposase